MWLTQSKQLYAFPLQPVNEPSAFTFSAEEIQELIYESKEVVKSNPREALELAQKALDLLGSHSDSSLFADVQYSLGRAHECLNNYGKAIQYMLVAVQYYGQMGNQRGLSNALNRMGVIYDSLGDYDKALTYYLQSLQILKGLDLPDLVAGAYNNIGLIYSTIGEEEKAVINYSKAIEIAEHHNLKEELTYPLHNLGDLHAARGQFDSALFYYQQSYLLDDSLQDLQGVGINLYSMADVYIRLNDVLKAESHLLEALEIHQSVNDKLSMSVTYAILGKLYMLKDNEQKAIASAESALKYAQEINTKLEIQNAARILSDIYRQKNDFKLALQYTDLCNQYKDSLFNEAKSRELALLHLQQLEAEKDALVTENQFKAEVMGDQRALIESQTYLVIFISFGLIVSFIILSLLNNANRDKRIANQQLVQQKEEIEYNIKELKSLNTSIKEQKNNLQKSNQIKDKLISIISHDFRSPLNSLEGILDLLAQGRISQEEMKVVARELRIKVSITTSLLDNLLNWAKNQMQGIKPNPETFDVLDLVNETVDQLHLQAEKKGLHIKSEVSRSEEIYADFEMTKLVLRNLLSNAIKFTSRGENVSIQSDIAGSFMKISVSDTGIGIPEEMLKKLFSEEAQTSLGTSQEKGTGLGLMLCKDFVEKNGGMIEVSSKTGEGSTFSFTVPLAEKEVLVTVKKKNELASDTKTIN
jgi:signal transduction histidine kinase